jgi:hypothetical protein
MRDFLKCRISPVYVLLPLALSVAIAYLLLQPTTYHKPADEFMPDRYMWPQSPLTEFSVKTAAEAARSLEPAELVLGVSVGNESRAYPINMLNHDAAAKVVNDVLGGRPLMATWCDSAHNAIVYSREVDGEALTFGIFGQLWKGSMVVYDQETMTHWSHILGEAKRGPLKGKKLTPIPSLVTDWECWRRLHPQSTVVALPSGDREYTRHVYDDPAPYLLGIAANGACKTWDLANLKREPVVNDVWQGQAVLAVFDRDHVGARLYARTVNGKELTFFLEGKMLRDRDTGTIWEPLTGEASEGPLAGQKLIELPAIVSKRDVWSSFHGGDR